MTAAVPTAERSLNPEAPVSRAVRLIRVVVLLVGGLTITFSATLHEQVGFDRGLASALIGALGIAHLIEWFSRRRSAPSVVPLLLGIVAIAAAVVLPLTGSTLDFSVAIAAWALVGALLEFIGAAVQPGSRQDAALLGAIGLLLSILVLLLREDPVATIGFLGAYAMIGGVFLGISAFDIRRGTGATPPGSPPSSPAPRADRPAESTR